MYAKVNLWFQSLCMVGSRRRIAVLGQSSLIAPPQQSAQAYLSIGFDLCRGAHLLYHVVADVQVLVIAGDVCLTHVQYFGSDEELHGAIFPPHQPGNNARLDSVIIMLILQSLLRWCL